MSKHITIICLLASAINICASESERQMAQALVLTAQADVESHKVRKLEAQALLADAQVRFAQEQKEREEIAAAERATIYDSTLRALLGQTDENGQHQNAGAGHGGDTAPGQSGGSSDASQTNSHEPSEVNLGEKTFKHLKGTLKGVVRKHAQKQKSLLRKEAKYKKEQAQLEHGHNMERLAFLGQGFNSLLEDKERLTNGALAIGGTALAIYLAKRSTGFAFAQAEAYLKKPALVDKTSRLDASTLFSPSYWRQRFFGNNRMKDVVVDPMLKARLDRIAHQTKNTKKHGGNLQHLLLYGQPGTGKTLFAENLALDSGMDYAILSGANLSRFNQAESLEELRKLFAWAEKSNKGTLLFFDECEGFAKKRGGSNTSEAHEKILSSWLKLTGTESKRVMLAGATNRPEDLDSAALSRFNMKVEFTLPREAERTQLILQYYRKHVQQHVKNAPTSLLEKIMHYFKPKGSLTQAPDLTDEQLELLVARTEGYSGRDISKMMDRIYTIGLAKDMPSVEFADCLLALDEIQEERNNLGNFKN